MKFISVGFGNMVCADRIVAVVSPDSSPVKRLIQDAKDGGRVIDASCGRKTRAVLVLDSDHVVLSALQTDTVSARLCGTSDQTGISSEEHEHSGKEEEHE
ncbi:MAG: DUF370 domain-containing protein [Clostridia bacterium]|nr:DUF370 domain-containing protein [Clostridia bacterium]